MDLDGGRGNGGGRSPLPTLHHAFPVDPSSVIRDPDRRQADLPFSYVSLLLLAVAASPRRRRLGWEGWPMSVGQWDGHGGFQQLYNAHRLEVDLRIDAALAVATRRIISFLFLLSARSTNSAS